MEELVNFRMNPTITWVFFIGLMVVSYGVGLWLKAKQPPHEKS